jgi:hypothetical protein
MQTHAFAALAVAAALLVSGCESNIQTTSGQAYLDRYQTADYQRPDGAFAAEVKSLDAKVREVAAVEPKLRFPARIGLARIENGELSGVPAEEAEAWMKAAEDLGPAFGQFVPLSILVAEMVSGPEPTQRYGRDYIASRMYRTMEKIRLGAARQHLDAVLVYEVYGKSEQSANPLALLNLTIIGAYVLPGESVHAGGFASALLLDVRNGYPYGTARKVVDHDTVTPSAGSYDRSRSIMQATMTRAAIELVPEVEDMFRKLQPALAALDAKPARADAAR